MRKSQKDDLHKESEEFKKKAYSLIAQFQELLNKMPYQGDTMEESQKMCLQHDLNELTYSVNGTNMYDFKEMDN